MPSVPADEIYEKYLQKAISEINELGDEIARSAHQGAVPVLGSGHPLADIFLLKYGPQRAELQEGLAFLSQRLHDLQLDGEPEYENPSGVYGLARLPVRFTL